MATARDIIERALRLIQVTAAGESIRDDEAQDALVALNGMLALWSTGVLATPYKNIQELSVSTQLTALATRPMRITNAWVNDGASDLQMRVISRKDFYSIMDKETTGVPASIYCDELYPTASIYIYPTPDKAYMLTLERWDRLTSLPTLETVISLPEEYHEALAANLAPRLAPEFGTTTSQEVAAMAVQSLDAIKALNAYPVDSMQCGIRSVQGNRLVRIPGDQTALFRGGW